MKVLITGGSGMVGRNLLDHTDLSQYNVLAPSSSELNLLSFSDVKAFLVKNSPDIIIHCAGVVGGIQANIANPVKFFLDNMQMALNVINAAKESEVPQLINLGSSCMYPRNAQNPLKELDILTGELEPTNEGYALAKIAGAKLCEYINIENVGFKYKTIIPCNLYGKFDKFGAHNSHMIPAVIAKIEQAVKTNASKVDIWGDGQARREFMYAGDLADFIVYALSRFDELPSMINVGLGHDFSINEYYQTVAKVLGFNGEFSHDLTKPVGMKQKLVDVSRLHSFGWKSKTSLEDGIRKTYQYYLELENDNKLLSS
jgi:GDP-L-fucose synthase